jgi:Lrp/AsnC family transcriptional regulator for asnA, asnC and gidA
MGTKLGLTEGAVRARVKRLVDAKVIESFTVSLNAESVGMKLLARIGVDAVPAEVKRIALELASFEEVYFVALATGRHDVLIDIITTDLDGLKKFIINKLAKIPGVRGSDSSIVMETYKWKGTYQYRV